MRSFKKFSFSSISTLKIRKMITISSINSIVEIHHLIVEINIRITFETIIHQTIDQMNTSTVEMNIEIEMINFKIVASKDALYVRNLIVDQSIIRKTSAMTRKSASSIDTHSSETIIDFVSTFWSMKMKKIRTMIIKRWFSISRKWH
jgi:hypothetical protein